MSKHKKISNPIAYLVLAALLVILVVGYKLLQSDQNDTTTTNPAPAINLEPPTKEEQSAGDLQKAEIINESTRTQESENSSTASLEQSATLAVTDASQYGDTVEIRAFVTNVVEDGTCTIKFSIADNIIEKSVPAYADASTTPCVTLNVDRSEFIQPGNWEYTITYTSATKTGSASGIIEIL